MELGAANLTAGHNLNLGNLGGVDGEGAFHAFAVGNLTNGESLVDAGATLGNDDALEDLHAFLATFNHAAVHLHGVANVEGRHVVLHLLFSDSVENVHLVSFL